MRNRALTQAVAAAIFGISVPFAANAGDEALAQFEDGATVTLSGIVTEVDDDEFEMSYGGDEIEVELEDWDWDDDKLEATLNVGDRVIVTGEVDDDWFSDRELEARNFYVTSLRSYFYADDRNPAYDALRTDFEMDDGSFVSLRGEVREIDGDEVTVESKGRMIEVEIDTDDLGYDPFDNDSVSRIEVGDRIYVYGETDDDFWNDQRIEAEMIVEINDASDFRS